MGSLEVVGTDLAAWYVCSNRKHRNPASVRIEQAIYQVQVSGTAATRANRQFPRYMRFGPGGKRGAFLMPHMNPIDGSHRPQCVGKAVERIPHYPVDTPD